MAAKISVCSAGSSLFLCDEVKIIKMMNLMNLMIEIDFERIDITCNRESVDLGFYLS